MIKEIARFNIWAQGKSVDTKQVICQRHILSF